MSSRAIAYASAIVAVGLCYLLFQGGKRPPSDRGQQEPLVLFCAAGLKEPVESIASRYTAEYGVEVQIQYGGSGTLLSSLKIKPAGDLFLAAEASYTESAAKEGLVREVLDLCRMTPVLGVAKGNPKNLNSLEDLMGEGVAFGLANPDAAAIGRVVRQVLEESGKWKEIETRAKVFKPTVNDLVNDIKIGALDAAFLWDAVLHPYPELEAVSLVEFSTSTETVKVGVLASSRIPRQALHFARFLAAGDRGQLVFKENGFASVEGDAWEEVPEIVLYSGGVNRVAIEETIEEFEEREGVDVTRVYNGCGILVSQIKAGANPDAYFACDVSFLPPVADRFLAPSEVTRTAVVILVEKGNPKSIHSLEDLAQPDLKLGVAHPEQSALGALTQRMLDARGIASQVLSNVSTQTPTADLLVNQMRTGSLDAAVVFRANASQVEPFLDWVPIEGSDAIAMQPFAVGKHSSHKALVGRLLKAIRSTESHARFAEAGFEWIQ